MVTRPAEYAKEWGKTMNFGVCRMLPTELTAHVSIHADFAARNADDLRRFAKWMIRAADYMERNNGK